MQIGANVKPSPQIRNPMGQQPERADRLAVSRRIRERISDKNSMTGPRMESKTIVPLQVQPTSATPVFTRACCSSHSAILTSSFRRDTSSTFSDGSERDSTCYGADPIGGGNRPASINSCRCSTQSGSLTRKTPIVARPTGVCPARNPPCQRKCSVQTSTRGLKSGTRTPVSGS